MTRNVFALNYSFPGSTNTSGDDNTSYDMLSNTHGLICGCSGCAGPIWFPYAGEDTAQPLGRDDLFAPDEPQFNGSGSSTTFVSSTGNQGIDGLIAGVRWLDTTISYSNPALASDYQVGYDSDSDRDGFSAQNEGFSQFNANQLDAIHFALNDSLSGGLNAASNAMSVDAFTNLNINYAGTNGSGTIRVANSSDPSTAYAYYPSTSVYGGDSFFGPDTTNVPMQAGNYQFYTAIHEMGHSLGLKHGHETDVFGAMAANLNSHEYSVMTYSSYIGSDTQFVYNEQWGFSQTWMMYDIAALQAMYGADFTSNAGNTVYSWSPNSGNTLINGQVAINPGANRIFATIWDGGGSDTYDLSAYGTGVEIDLSPGGHSMFSTGQLANLGAFASSPDPEFARGNIFNALQYQNDARSLIENAIGGSGNDVIIGNSANNVLEGGGGNDTLSGGAGTNDVAVYNGNQSQYSFSGDETSATVTGTEGTDTLAGIEILRFADGDVRLDGAVEEYFVQRVRDSFTVVQSEGDTYVGNSSDQTYNINPFLTEAGRMITIIDQGGNNVIELPAGLSITSSQVVSNQTILTLSNGAVVDIRGADTFTYNVGHSMSTGDNIGAELSFAAFAQNILGVTLQGGTVVQGGSFTVNDNGTASGGSTANMTLAQADSSDGPPQMDDLYDPGLVGMSTSENDYAIA